MFVRQKKENFLTLNNRAADDIQRVTLNLFSLTQFIAIPLNSSINISRVKEIIPSTDNGIFRRVCLVGQPATFFSEK